MTQPTETNRFAVWSLVATGLLLFPLGIVLGLIAAFQIHRSGRPARGAAGRSSGVDATQVGPSPVGPARARQDGWLFVAISLFISGLVAPGAVWALLHGRPRAFDSCYHTQENAVGILRLVSYLEEKHREETGRYGNLAEIGFKPRVSTKPYRYAVETHEADHFVAVARGTGMMEGDLLTVDESQRVKRVQNRCLAVPAP